VKGRKNAGLLTNFDRHGREHRFKPASGPGAKAKYTIAYGLRTSGLLQGIYQLGRTVAEIQFFNCSAQNLLA
jgi:hypothetical protein